jgi:hypothetical protein
MPLAIFGLVQELFRLVDDDSDGHLTAEEFVQAMKLPSVEQYLAYLESLAMRGRRGVG